MKLLVVMPSGIFRGGAEESLLHLACAHRTAGIELSVVFLEDGDLPARVAGEGVKVFVVPAGRLRQLGRYVQTVMQIRGLILKESPHAVLSWMTKAHIYSGMAARLCGVPPIYYQMGLPDGTVVDRLSRWIPAAGALACSEFAARAQRRVVGHPVVGVPLAADRAKFSSMIPAREMKARLGFAPDRPLVGIVGRLQRWKGQRVFAKAMAEVLRDQPDCQAVIVGGVHELEPDYPEILEASIADMGLANAIRMVGAQTNVSEWMQAMDVVVHASEREPFGIVVLEAMCLGKPVVATRPGGPEEIIRDGFNGALVAYGDVSGIARTALRFLKDSEFSSRCAAGALERSRDFTPERFACALRDGIFSISGK